MPSSHPPRRRPTVFALLAHLLFLLLLILLLSPPDQVAAAHQVVDDLSSTVATSVPGAIGVLLNAPIPLTPGDGASITGFSPTLTWTLPPQAVQMHLQVVPAAGDGPGLDLIRGAATWYTLPAPPQWYGLLPDMTYTWRLRASAATWAIGSGDASWGPWSNTVRFHTAPASSGSISLGSPAAEAAVTTLTPLLQWAESDPSVWYYEVQLSKDATFTTDPRRATAAVYWELRHGGVTNPPRSYAVPATMPLEPGTVYYWRVRPRVQGDGQPVAWSSPARFRTPAAGSPPGQPNDLADRERQVMAEINAVRAGHGLAAVGTNARLTDAARRHSADMAQHSFMSHTGSDGSSFVVRISDTGYDWMRAGEIVAYGYRDAASVTEGWMNSPGHRAIILTSDYREAGAGVVRSANGTLYWTVDFASPMP